MMIDRTTKFLLSVIALALLGLLLRPLVVPSPAQAAEPSISLASVSASNGLIYVVQGGRLYEYNPLGRNIVLKSWRDINTKP